MTHDDALQIIKALDGIALALWILLGIVFAGVIIK